MTNFKIGIDPKIEQMDAAMDNLWQSFLTAAEKAEELQKIFQGAENGKFLSNHETINSLISLAYCVDAKINFVQDCIKLLPCLENNRDRLLDGTEQIIDSLKKLNPNAPQQAKRQLINVLEDIKNMLQSHKDLYSPTNTESN